MAKRSVLGLLYLLQGLHAADENMQLILQKLSLDVEQLDPSATIDLKLEYAIQQQVVAYVTHPAVGLYIGQQFNLAGYGPLLMLLMTSPDLHEAMRLGVYYQKITFLFGRLGLEQQHDLTVLTYDSLENDPVLHRFRSDAEIAGTFKLLKDMQAALGLHIRLERVDLPFVAPQAQQVIEQYEKFYDAPVYFDQSRGAIYCKTAALNHKITAADAATHQRYQQQCDEALAQYLVEEKQGISLKEQVLDYLKLQGYFMPPVAAVAQALGLSERTLRYRLAEQGTSFRQLRNQLRFESACELLKQERCSIEQIAETLQYNEASAFIHAFSRWSGISPNQYRKLHVKIS
ncbi:AraC family transcriptional regulator ligand-binding domain-containing protein [Alkanindiges sp. WGS2144]|uniref:AraC family transcriptional regulator n=1 Tax=Alkanindiges sp. WGS2144 TaxID=3366808 RepID=UPI003753BEDC